MEGKREADKKIREAREAIVEAQLRLRTAINNAAFFAQSPAQQRVTIAKDVISELRSGRFRASSGLYFEASGFKADDALDYAEPEDELSDVLTRVDKCNVCALGAVFVCGVQRADNLTVQGAGGYQQKDMHEYLSRFFSVSQLHLIETAFEKGEVGSRGDVETEEAVAAVGFWRNLTTPNPENRMLAIMENIIRNNGKFKPKQPAVLPKLSPGRSRRKK